jgi:hypothetical protein
MATEYNRQVLPALFVGYRIGMILDPLKTESIGGLIFNRKQKE